MCIRCIDSLCLLICVNYSINISLLIVQCELIKCKQNTFLEYFTYFKYMYAGPTRDSAGIFSFCIYLNAVIVNILQFNNRLNFWIGTWKGELSILKKIPWYVGSKSWNNYVLKHEVREYYKISNLTRTNLSYVNLFNRKLISILYRL